MIYGMHICGRIGTHGLEGRHMTFQLLITPEEKGCFSKPCNISFPKKESKSNMVKY